MPTYTSVEAGRDSTAREWVSSYESVEISTDTSGLAVASGHLNITEGAPETMQVGIYSFFTSDYLGQVSLDAVGGGNVFSIGIAGSGYEDPPDFLVPLSPGQYTLTWTTGGDGGENNFFFTMAAVPEPSSGLLLIALAGAMVFIKRDAVDWRFGR